MADDMDALLKEALADFGAEIPEQANAPSSSTPAATKAPDTPQVSAAPSGLGPSGLGLKLPARPASSKPQPPAGLAFDPLKKAAPSKPGAGHAASGDKDAAASKLPPHMQALADELMKLVEESGLGDGAEEPGAGPGGPPGLQSLEGLEQMFNNPTLRAMAQQMQQGEASGFGGMGLAGPSTAGPSGAGAAPASSGQSATVKGLMQQTKKTVEQQSKFSRGEAAQAAAAAAASKGPGGGGGGGFGGLLGGLGGEGGLLASLAAGGGGGEPGGMNFMVDFIMQNLLSKDVLYAPLKEIRDKYPPWLEKAGGTESPESMERYNAQYAAIQAVCSQYETDPANFGRLVELIQEMQKHGDPPAAIVEEIGGSIQEDLKAGAGEGGDDAEGLRGFGGLGDGDLDPEDLANFKLPPEMLKDLPKELQQECCIM